MGKNPATTGSNSKKLVRSYQMSQLFFDLCQVTNTKAKFFEAILFKFKSYLNRRLSMKTICLWPKLKQLFAQMNKQNRVLCPILQIQNEDKVFFSKFILSLCRAKDEERNYAVSYSFTCKDILQPFTIFCHRVQMCRI